VAGVVGHSYDEGAGVWLLLAKKGKPRPTTNLSDDLALD